jgi:hypothetical protein
VEALDPRPMGTPSCNRSAQLKLAVSNRGGFRKLFLVGVDEERNIKWYAPRPPQSESVDAPVGDVDVPVGSAVRLEVNHDPGSVRVYALFSDEPLMSAEVERAIASLPPIGPLPEALPLARTDVLQRSILFDITP